MKSKARSILLLFCLAAPLVATFTFLKLQKMQVKHQVKQTLIAGIEKEELVLLKFTKEETQTDLHWEHAKEFEYNGQMYDVVEKSVQGDTIYYWCWWDYEETQLNRELNRLVANALGNNQERNKNKENLIRFYSSLFQEQSDWQLNTSTQGITKSVTPYRFSCLVHALCPPVPPPQIG